MAYPKEEKDKIFSEICDLIASGLSLRNAIDKSGTISKKVFFDWIDSEREKSDQYAQAMVDRADLKFESIEKDYLETPQRDPETGRIDPGWVNLQRLKIDAKKWELSKLMPKKYGDRLELDNKLSGEVNIISLGSGKKPDESNH